MDAFYMHQHRAIQLEAEFRNTPQGDMPISTYCAQLKTLSDSLTNVGQLVGNETLILTVLHGLSKPYAHLHSFLSFQTPFPSFLQTCSVCFPRKAKRKWMHTMKLQKPYGRAATVFFPASVLTAFLL
jgi:hypothetical protein